MQQYYMCCDRKLYVVGNVCYEVISLMEWGPFYNGFNYAIAS